jgi:hypothetical protein
MLDMTRIALVAAIGAALVGPPLACGGSDELFSQGTSTAVGGDAGSGGSAGSTATSSGGSGGSSQGGEDAGRPDAAICESQQLDGIPVELDMFLVVDRSGSMSGPLWTATVSALDSFFTDPLSAGINVALNLFPPMLPSGDCVPTDYHPVQYPDGAPPLYRLPDDSTLLHNILFGAAPSGLTPMYAALDGTYTSAAAWQGTYPDHEVVVVLMSDGQPNSCAALHGIDEITACANLASAASSGTYIKTYCVVIDAAAMAALTAVAQAGGTTTPYDVSGNLGLFAQVMAEIRDQARGCEIIIPDGGGTTFDPSHLYVHYLAGGTAPPQPIPEVAGEGSCGSGDGWYFDDLLDPTRIVFCPTSCTTINGDPNAEITLEFGCVP